MNLAAARHRARAGPSGISSARMIHRFNHSLVLAASLGNFTIPPSVSTQRVCFTDAVITACMHAWHRRRCGLLWSKLKRSFWQFAEVAACRGRWATLFEVGGGLRGGIGLCRPNGSPKQAV
eukprot:366077-Chlamydomonas_euryale.AAC.3